MAEPKLYILPANRAPRLLTADEPSRPVQKTRIFDANGTEFVGIESVTTEGTLDSPVDNIITIQLRTPPLDVVVVDAPPASLVERLRTLAAGWRTDTTAGLWDNEGYAADGARDRCADELEALLAEVKP